MGIVTSLTLATDPALAAEMFGDPALPRGVARGWDLLGNVPVPLRQHVQGGVAQVVADHRAAGGARWRCCFPMGQGGRTPFERLRFIRAVDDFPHVLVSAEHGNAFNRRFQRDHLRRDTFTAAQVPPDQDAFTRAGLIDPAGIIGVFAVAPFVFLVDHRRLNGVAAPASFADLADPAYRGQVVFGGWRRQGERRYSAYNKHFLLAIARALGWTGLRAVLANVATLIHSAQMPRLAGSDASPGGIYVLPWGLADMCPRRTYTQVIWPTDGALAYPLWLTVKNAQRRRLAALVDYFHGAALGTYLNHNRYPALAPGLAPVMPKGARLSWLGWDYVRHRSCADDIRRAVRLFEEEGPQCA